MGPRAEATIFRRSRLGRRRTAEGYAIPLSESLKPPDLLDRRAAGTAQDRRADRFPGPHDPDDSPVSPGLPVRKDDRATGVRPCTSTARSFPGAKSMACERSPATTRCASSGSINFGGQGSSSSADETISIVETGNVSSLHRASGNSGDPTESEQLMQCGLVALPRYAAPL